MIVQEMRGLQSTLNRFDPFVDLGDCPVQIIPGRFQLRFYMLDVVFHLVLRVPLRH